MDELTAFHEAWRSGAYLLAIAILVGGLTRVLRLYEPLWSRLPDDKKRWIPVALAGLAAFAQAVFDASQSAPPATMATKAILTAVVSALSAIGGHHFVNPTKHAAPANPTPLPRDRIYLEPDPDRTPTDHGVHIQKVEIVVTSNADPSKLARAIKEHFAQWARSRVPLVVLVALVAVGCSTIKPLARTVHEASKILCETFFAERQGISLEEAARQYCATERQLRPFIDQAVSAQQAAGAAAAQQGPE